MTDIDSSVFRKVARSVVDSPEFDELLVSMIAQHLEERLRAEFAGESIYIPKTSSKNNKQTRNELIRSAFTGNNWEFLTKKFGLCERHLRRIIEK